ncbi:hypothetical protein [Streptomyces sp. WAC06614]|uniref:hypothetical protein n=1 Tax=Streptomyces sp. WAC06614 TaxID=2487416 RepID=UPI000F795187|nr:hypothetical protein [Streptomyces sp. WAC06614]RSS82811.1 hypothetical protein EF918_05625 [Streptomyces sp. WAC06614]
MTIHTLEMYAWPSTSDEGPDALPMVHFTTEQLVGDEVTPEGVPVWLFDTAIRDGGWVHFTDYEGWAATAAGWNAVYRQEDDALFVTGPGACEGWYQGYLGAPEDWRAAAAAQQKLVLLTAPVPHPSHYAHAVEQGAGFALLVPLSVI